MEQYMTQTGTMKMPLLSALNLDSLHMVCSNYSLVCHICCYIFCQGQLQCLVVCLEMILILQLSMGWIALEMRQAFSDVLCQHLDYNLNTVLQLYVKVIHCVIGHDCTNIMFIHIGITVEASNCSDGELRLSGAALTNQGRLEVCVNGAWGSVCDSQGVFTTDEAKVACRQLGILQVEGLQRR